MFLDDFENLDIFTKGEFATLAQVLSANSTLTERTSQAGEETSPVVSSLWGIFDDNYQPMFDGIDTQATEGRNFCFQVQTAEIGDLSHGDRLIIKGKNYQIISLKPQHDGKLTHIILKEDYS